MLPLVKIDESSRYFDEVMTSFYQEWTDLYNIRGIYSSYDLRSIYKNPKIKLYIYIINNDFIGSYSFLENEDGIYLCDVFIHENYRKKGVGVMLIKDAKHRASKNYGVKFLYVCSGMNTLDFYRKCGFKIIKYIDDGIIILRCKLKQKRKVRWLLVIILLILIVLIADLLFKLLE